MCGIFGYIGQQEFDRKNIKLLGLFNEDRGTDSTGIYNHYKDLDFDKRLLKENTKISNSDILTNNIKRSRLLIGHTRNSSVGSTKFANIHPLQFNDNICGVHNGTISNYKELAEKYGVSVSNNNSDSYILFEILGKTGGDIETVLADIEGQATLAFTLNDDRLYLYRKDNQRPLYTSHFHFPNSGVDDDSLYFSSTEESLKAIDEVPSDSVKALKTGVVYEYDLDVNLRGEYEIKENPKKPKASTTPTRSGSYTGNYTSGSRSRNYGDYYDWDWWNDPGDEQLANIFSPKNKSDLPNIVYPQSKTFYQSSLDTKYIENERIVKATVFKCEGSKYTKYELESGAISVFKGELSYNPVTYNRNTAVEIFDDLSCEEREIVYNLLMFGDGSFMESTEVIEEVDVHEEEVGGRDIAQKLFEDYSFISLSVDRIKKLDKAEDCRDEAENLEKRLSTFNNHILEMTENKIRNDSLL